MSLVSIEGMIKNNVRLKNLNGSWISIIEALHSLVSSEDCPCIYLRGKSLFFSLSRCLQFFFVRFYSLFAYIEDSIRERIEVTITRSTRSKLSSPFSFVLPSLHTAMRTRRKTIGGKNSRKACDRCSRLLMACAGCVEYGMEKVLLEFSMSLWKIGTRTLYSMVGTELKW